jgi:L-fuconolactonase
MIVDTHVHIVAEDRKKYPSKADAPAWPLTTAEMLLSMMDANGIDRALLVQTYFTYGTDNGYVADSAVAHPDRFLGVCVLDPLAPDAPDQLSALYERGRVRGIRLMNDRKKNVISIDDPKTFPLWERIAALKIPVCMAALIEDIPLVRVPAERFPQVPIALDHLWGLKVESPKFEMIQPFLDLARHPNIYVKTAPNNSVAVREVKGDTQAFYQRIVDAFGAKRIMWGSNYPAHTQAYGGIKERLALGRADLGFLSADEQKWIFGETALTLWPELRK